MIERYSREEMKQLWSQEQKFLHWLIVELQVCSQLAEDGFLSEEEWNPLSHHLGTLIQNGGVDVASIEEEEKKVKHDVIAFLSVIEKNLGKEARWIHYGLTSSDVLDTSNAMLIQKAGKIILKDIDQILKVLKTQNLSVLHP